MDWRDHMMEKENKNQMHEALTTAHSEVTDEVMFGTDGVVLKGAGSSKVSSYYAEIKPHKKMTSHDAEVISWIWLWA